MSQHNLSQSIVLKNVYYELRSGGALYGVEARGYLEKLDLQCCYRWLLSLHTMKRRSQKLRTSIRQNALPC